MRQVVLVPAVVVPGVRLEQVIPGGELEGHAGSAPDISGWAVTGAKQHLECAVLASLDILGVVMILDRDMRKDIYALSESNAFQSDAVL